MSIGTDDLARITQQTDVVSSDGDTLGSVNQVYTSDTTGDPAWVTVKTGLFGTKESFVPLSDASFDGDDIRVGVTKEAVRDAPRVDTDGHLSPEEEDELYRHYGLHDPDQGDAPVGTGVDDRHEDDRGHDAAAVGTAAAAGGGVGALAGDRDDRDRDDHDRDSRLGDDRGPEDRAADDRPGDDRVGDRTGDDPTGAGDGIGDQDRDGGAGRTAAAAGAGGAAGSALGGGFGRDRHDDEATGTPRHAATDDRSVAAENGPEHAEPAGTTGAGEGDREAVKPGERTTRLRRYVVTERVVQTVEELPDEEGSPR